MALFGEKRPALLATSTSHSMATAATLTREVSYNTTEVLK